MVVELIVAQVVPYLALVVALFVVLFAFSSFASLGGMFGFDLTQFLANPVLRIAALILFAYIIYWVVKALAQAMSDRDAHINPFLLSVLLASSVLLFNFGYFGKLLSVAGQPEPAPMFPAVDAYSAVLGALVGAATVLAVDLIGSKFKKTIFRGR